MKVLSYYAFLLLLFGVCGLVAAAKRPNIGKVELVKKYNYI